MSDKAELRAAYKRLHATLTAERKMREQVFKPGDPRRERKIAEIDQALADLQLLGRFVGAEIEAQDIRQAQLLDVPTKGGY